MTDRSSLGSADVPDDVLERMVADLLGHGSVAVVAVDVTRVDYDVPSLTTIGRWWVSGLARTPLGDQPFRLFVKHVQAWHHSAWFQLVPEEAREHAASSYPWRLEAAVYRSDLAHRLPPGLSMPRALGVFDREPDSVVVWLEPVEHATACWDGARFERAAHLLGRLSANRAVAELADVGQFDWTVLDYVTGRVQHDVVPRVMGDEVWQQPHVERWFGDLRERLRDGCGRAEALGRELTTLPRVTCHGDAAPGNLLPGHEPDSFVLIDFGFWAPNPVGFDLGQLIGGDVQLGRLPDVPLGELDDRCVGAYTRGLGDEDCHIPLDVVRRAHALQLFLFSGVSSLPDEGMSEQQTAARAQLARLSLDLLDRTG
jgi:hypothetical protein